MKIVVPMAGRGERFQALSHLVSDYALPKPMIPVLGKPMVQWAVESYSSFLSLGGDAGEKPLGPSDLVFVCLEEHEEKFSISDFLRKVFCPDVNVVFAERVTRGPAETAFLAREYIHKGEDLIVSDCDHHFDAGPLWDAIRSCRKEGPADGILPLIKPEDKRPTWSYVVLDGTRVLEIKEKDVRLAESGAYGVIGAYYFRDGIDFVNEAERMIDEDDRVGDKDKAEFYMSRIYQRMIDRGSHIGAAFIKRGHILGTPQQLQRFIDSRKGDSVHV